MFGDTETCLHHHPTDLPPDSFKAEMESPEGREGWESSVYDVRDWWGSHGSDGNPICILAVTALRCRGHLTLYASPEGRRHGVRLSGCRAQALGDN